jgi:thiol-disulfide isomerase/thioredoxin
MWTLGHTIKGEDMDVNGPDGVAEGEKSKAAEVGGKASGRASRGKVLIGAVLAVAVMAGLYFINRYWIAPALHTQAMTSGEHPEAPPISLTDIEGKRLDLADYKGKVVVLDFWATWCGPCRIEIPGLIEMQDKYAKEGFSVIGISFDDEAEPVVQFYKDYKMNYPVAVGNQRIGELYGGVLGLPTTFLIGRDGRIYAKHTGATNPSIIEDEVRQLLAMSPTAENMSFIAGMTAGTSTKIELGDPAAIDSEIPGLNLTKLTAEQKETLKKQLGEMKCPCGCNLTVMKCRQVDRACPVSLKLAREQMEKLLKPTA